MRGTRRAPLRALIAASALALCGPARGGTTPDLLLQGFLDPPAEARPRVFWHWMNGNIGEAGIDLDLAWMRRAGVGGAQIVEADLSTPTIVPERKVFGTPAWNAAVAHAAATARRLGMELGVATSPGWSSTGGPWVQPAQAMKKLVWSEAEVVGGAAGPVRLPPLPSVAGPFQDVAAPDAPTQAKAPFSVDTVVLAYPIPADADADVPAPHLTSSGGALDPRRLFAGDVADAQALPLTPGTRQAWVRLDYSTPRTVRALTLGLPGARGFGAPPSPDAWLEASEDGTGFHRVATLPAGPAQQRTVAFPAVRARSFRVVFERPAATPLPSAPGSVPMSLPPTPDWIGLSEFLLHGETRVNHAEEKGGFAVALDYAPLATPEAPSGSVVPKAGVVNLTGRLRPDGTLDWRAPPGRWKVLRLGYALTGHPNGPAEPEATGLEADKLDGQAVRDHFDAYLGRYTSALGGLKPAGVGMMLADSIEAGPQNWTSALPEAFSRRYGYDLTPWLPALTGVVVESAAASDRFLWDFRQTIAEMFIAGQTTAVAAASHTRGLKLYSEALEDHRPQLGDDMAMRRLADFPMGAMWTFPPGGEPRPTYVADLQGAASVAHIYGQNLVAAESMTSFGEPWAFSPRLLKPIADRELLLGVNQFVIHSSVHQPLVDAAPGLTLAIQLGQDFNRNETWAEMARPWMDYLARSAFLMRQGRAVADVAYFYGEDTPLTALYGDRPVPDAPPGYGFDFVNRDALMSRLSVRNGRLTTPAGGDYAILYLGGDSGRMTLPVLRRIAVLAEAGAVVVGPKPGPSPSLADDPAAFTALSDRLWRGAERPGGRGVGQGRIIAGVSAAEALAELSLPRDFAATVAGVEATHRHLSDGDLYFVVNTTGAPVQTEARFRVEGRIPELWHADTTERTPLGFRREGQVTSVPLSLEPYDAAFVVFRAPTVETQRAVSVPHMEPLITLQGPWRIAFQPDRGVPKEIDASKLEALNESAWPGVRYFSGIATYSTRFNFHHAAGDGRVALDLGDVREVARVTLNGHLLSEAWRPPYRLDVSGLLRNGENRLRVEVADLWVNRLIGDAQPGAVHKAYVTSPAYRADAPLLPSGLIGPVRLFGSTPPDSTRKASLH